ncbi:MAG: hypothetical protein ACRDIY_10960 [Chloroflexota bacterium]
MDVVVTWPREELAARLRERSKRDLIESMLVRSPNPGATEKLVIALEAYPLVYLLLASEHPTKIWILDRDEKVSSADILTPEMRGRRWHSANLSIDDCEGLTDAAPGLVAMVASWRSVLVMRHEFAHVVTTFFSPDQRAALGQLFLRSQAADHFSEPLARESIGEFVACAISYLFFDDLRADLSQFDPVLYRFVSRLLSRAEDLSQTILLTDAAHAEGETLAGRPAAPEWSRSC